MTTANQEAQRGRPRFSDKKVAAYESPLYKLFEKKLDHFVRRGRLNVRALAADLGVRAATVYRWCQLNRITPNGAKLVVEASRGKLTTTDIADFVIES